LLHSFLCIIIPQNNPSSMPPPCICFGSFLWRSNFFAVRVIFLWSNSLISRTIPTGITYRVNFWRSAWEAVKFE
jgi:hypothetical protein